MRILSILLISVFGLRALSTGFPERPNAVLSQTPTAVPGDTNTSKLFQIDALVLEVQAPPQSEGKQSDTQDSLNPYGCFLNAISTNLHVLCVAEYAAIAATNAAGDSTHGFTCLATLGNSFESVLAAITNSGCVDMLLKPRVITSNSTPALLFIGPPMSRYGGYPSSSKYPHAVVLEITPSATLDDCATINITQQIEPLQRPRQDLPTPKTETTSAVGKVCHDQTIVLCGGGKRIASRRTVSRELIVIIEQRLVSEVDPASGR